MKSLLKHGKDMKYDLDYRFSHCNGTANEWDKRSKLKSYGYSN